mmetsp:Transcript_101232/g.241414  ORF Transcript_101232/g.241414 Transcript_101232/m.241414 type:complete len:213 (-) Transcript_101232:1867-2505(-)
MTRQGCVPLLFQLGGDDLNRSLLRVLEVGQHLIEVFHTFLQDLQRSLRRGGLLCPGPPLLLAHAHQQTVTAHTLLQEDGRLLQSLLIFLHDIETVADDFHRVRQVKHRLLQAILGILYSLPEQILSVLSGHFLLLEGLLQGQRRHRLLWVGRVVIIFEKDNQGPKAHKVSRLRCGLDGLPHLLPERLRLACCSLHSVIGAEDNSNQHTEDQG